MPELPEIQTLARQLQKKISGWVLSQISVRTEQILKSPKKDFENKLRGRRILGVSRRGKFLRVSVEGDLLLWFHLGMTGQLICSQTGAAADPHIHFVLHFQDRSSVLIFRDPRKFGSISLSGGRPESLPEGVRLLGPDPFQISADAFAGLFKSRTGRIKSLLLNQRLISGIGNIYADESLHRAGIDPRRRPHRIHRERLVRLHGAICQTMTEAIRKGGSSIDDYLHADGGRGSFQDFHRVYGRSGEPCPACGQSVRQVRLAGRSASFCAQCQK